MPPADTSKDFPLLATERDVRQLHVNLYDRLVDSIAYAH